MSERYSQSTETGSITTSETSTTTLNEREPAPDSADRHQDTSTAERRDYGQDHDAAIEARLDEADLPTRAESRAATWGPDATDEDDPDFGDEYDSDLQALLATHDDGLPSRAESRAATWGPDATDEDNEPALGPESGDAAIEARLDEADLPTRAESRAATWGPAATSDETDAELAGEYDGDLSAVAAGRDGPAEQDSGVTGPSADPPASESASVNSEQSFEARRGTGPPTTVNAETQWHAEHELPVAATQDQPGAALHTQKDSAPASDHELERPGQPEKRDDLPASGDLALWRAMYQEFRETQASDTGRESGSNVVGDKPDRSPGDISDLPPTGEQLLEAESDEATRPEKFRNKVYRAFDDVTDAAKDQGEAVQNLLERPPPAGHPEVAVPSRPEIVPASSQQGPIDAGTMVETFLVVGVLGYEIARWLRHKVNSHGRS
ncbi:MAG TPA: hypothetical protein VN969_31675 [Streptosporangiaceae bacterium]|nr:hypothetical protein [Streptosporangiaceae bacterium]